MKIYKCSLSASPSSLPSRRYHDLDALRAAAMLLGIVLHSLLSFVSLPIWPAQDLHQHTEVFGFIQHAIHGFRMPLFFLISGFFTTMLWRKRGLGGLVKQRALRILVPLFVALVFIWPMMIAIGIWGAQSKAKVQQLRSGLASANEQTIWTAAKEGDLTTIDEALTAGQDINARDHMDISPLAWAVMQGQLEAVSLLLERGADVHASNGDGSTPLHAAAFLGGVEAVQLLLDAGADVNRENHKGERPLGSAAHGWEVVQWIAGMLELELADQEAVMAGKKEVTRMLEEAGAIASSGKGEQGQGSAWKTISGIWAAGAFIPAFHHLWFLHYLWMLVLVFMLAAAVKSKIPQPIPGWLVSTPLCWLWLIPLTFLPQYYMRQTFGVDTATGILPWPPKFFYYWVFFSFGALCYGRSPFEEHAGKFWPLHFILSIPCLIAGLYFLEHRGEDFVRNQALCSLFAVLYAWFMIFGSIGFFRRFYSAESRVVRYISDSAYWLYLAHLPLVMALQIIVSPWDLPGWVKFIMVCGVATGILLILYDLAIRYTFIGAVLNGKKHRSS